MSSKNNLKNIFSEEREKYNFEQLQIAKHLLYKIKKSEKDKLLKYSEFLGIPKEIYDIEGLIIRDAMG